MILIGNQMVYSWNKGIILLAFCPNPNNFPRIKAREIIRIWKKRAWNYSLISLVTIWLHILTLNKLRKWPIFGCPSSLQRNEWNFDFVYSILRSLCARLTVNNFTVIVRSWLVFALSTSFFFHFLSKLHIDCRFCMWTFMRKLSTCRFLR